MDLSKLGPGVSKKIATAVTLLLTLVMSAPLVASYGGMPAPLDSSYGGRGYGVGVVTPFGGTYYADTGNLPSSGGVLFADFTSVDTDVANALVWLSYARGFNDVAISEPATSDVTLLSGNPLEVGASFVYSRSVATAYDVSGYSEIFDLTIGGISYGVSGEANQVIYSIPGVFTLVANEVIDNSFGVTHSITVNALHLWTPGLELIVSSATSTVTSGGGGLPGLFSGGSTGTRSYLEPRGTTTSGGGLPRPLHAPPADFMTGGGHFLPPNSSRPGDVNFGFNAGPRPGQPTVTKGNLNLIDHYASHHLKGDVKDYFAFGDPQDVCRRFAGPANWDGADGYIFEAVGCDYGEPGRYDRIAVEVHTGAWGSFIGPLVYYADDGRSGGCPSNMPYCGELDGGNIQLHRF